jgi:hypothetical protein
MMIPGSHMGLACIFPNGPVTCQELLCSSCATPSEPSKLEGLDGAGPLDSAPSRSGVDREGTVRPDP